MRDRLLKPAIDHRRLGQFLTGDWVKNIPALTLHGKFVEKQLYRLR